VLAELAKMADRVVESREALARSQGRVQQLETDLATANDRILAARGLVHEAQQTARDAVEQSRFLEGRCTALEHALDLALNASLLQRWRWRRRIAKGFAARSSANAG
jgi:hypothetical protein